MRGRVLVDNLAAALPDFRPGETKKAFHRRMVADVATYAAAGAGDDLPDKG